MGYGSGFFLNMQFKRQDYYELLGVKRGESDETISAQYKKLKRTFHPDRATTEAQKEQFNQKFILIKEAYEVLTKQKEEYHAFLDGGIFQDELRNETFINQRKTESNEVEEMVIVEQDNQGVANPLNIPQSIYDKLTKAKDFAFVQLDQSDKKVLNFNKRSRDFAMNLDLTESQMRLGAVSRLSFMASRMCLKCRGNNSNCTNCQNQRIVYVKKDIAVKIPPTYLGERFVLKNVGIQEFGKTIGDLHVYIGNYDLNWQFNESKQQFITQLAVDEKTLKSGGLLKVPYIDKKSIFVKVPENAKHNSRLVLKGKGFVKDGKSTDLVIKLKQEGKFDITNLIGKGKHLLLMLLAVITSSTLVYFIWRFFVAKL